MSDDPEFEAYKELMEDYGASRIECATLRRDLRRLTAEYDELKRQVRINTEHDPVLDQKKQRGYIGNCHHCGKKLYRGGNTMYRDSTYGVRCEPLCTVTP